MEVLATFSFKKGFEIMKKKYPKELNEIYDAINNIEGKLMRTKESKEKTMPGKMLFSPKAMNRAILEDFLYRKDWKKPRIKLDRHGSFIEADAVKNGVGVEVQFGKYAFLGWDIFGKMIIFSKQKHYKVGVEIVAMNSLQREMSSGVGSFQQIVNILKARGESDIDIPVAVLGIGLKSTSTRLTAWS
jgi:hypothetical protein